VTKVLFTARGTPYTRTSVAIIGQAQIDMFDAMCAVAGRRPHELAAELVLEAIRASQADPDMQGLVTAARQSRRRRAGGLSVVNGGGG
jgi:hypothetical protein